MDQIEHFTTANELTRNRFVEMAVEVFKAQNISTASDLFHETDQAVDAQAISKTNNTANESDKLVEELRTINNVDAQDTNVNNRAEESHQIANDCQQSSEFRQNVLPELQVRLRERKNEIQQSGSSEAVTQQSSVSEIQFSESIQQRLASNRRPRPESINMRSALAMFREMEQTLKNELKNGSNNPTKSFPRPSRSRSEYNISLRRSSPRRPLLSDRHQDDIAEQRRSSNRTFENPLNVDSSDPLNQSLMVDIDDAESIKRIVEIGFEESLATAAFFAANRNLEAAVESLLEETATE